MHTERKYGDTKTKAEMDATEIKIFSYATNLCHRLSHLALTYPPFSCALVVHLPHKLAAKSVQKYFPPTQIDRAK